MCFPNVSINKCFLNKKALVTGGAGFIGSHLVESLVMMGVETISLDNYSAGKKENIEHLECFSNFEPIDGSVLNKECVEDILSKGVDFVFHLAATKKNICLDNPLLDLDVNSKGALILLELCRKYKIKKYVHASTGSVYGEPKFTPQNEDHPLNPTSYYGVSKLAGEKYVQVFNQLYDLDTTVLRYFHVYGPRQDYSENGGVVSIFMNNILNRKNITIYGDGCQTRSFTFVDDVVNANIHAVANSRSKGKIYNCASGIKVTILDLISRIISILRVPEPSIIFENWKEGDIREFVISNEAIKDELGIAFQTDMEPGLYKIKEWLGSLK